METIKIKLPRSYGELSDDRLYYLYSLFCENLSSAQVKTFCLFKWGGLRVSMRYAGGYVVKHDGEEVFVTPQEVASVLNHLDWIDVPPVEPVRISRIGGAEAVDAEFQGVEFEKFLMCDNLYQSYLNRPDHRILADMAAILYGVGGMRLNKAEKVNVFYWWTSLKSHLATHYPHFLQPSLGFYKDQDDMLLSQQPLARRLAAAMNAQIRALTKGDVTKEREVLQIDTWRALAELDALAHEAEELRKRYKK